MNVYWKAYSEKFKAVVAPFCARFPRRKGGLFHEGQRLQDTVKNMLPSLVFSLLPISLYQLMLLFVACLSFKSKKTHTEGWRNQVRHPPMPDQLPCWRCLFSSKHVPFGSAPSHLFFTSCDTFLSIVPLLKRAPFPDRTPKFEVLRAFVPLKSVQQGKKRVYRRHPLFCHLIG